MGVHEDWSDILDQLKGLKGELDSIVEKRDTRHLKRFEQIEGSLNDLYRRLQRPGRDHDHGDDDERKTARDLCILKFGAPAEPRPKTRLIPHGSRFISHIVRRQARSVSSRRIA